MLGAAPGRENNARGALRSRIQLNGNAVECRQKPQPAGSLVYGPAYNPSLPYTGWKEARTSDPPFFIPRERAESARARADAPRDFVRRGRESRENVEEFPSPSRCCRSLPLWPVYFARISRGIAEERDEEEAEAKEDKEEGGGRNAAGARKKHRSQRARARACVSAQLHIRRYRISLIVCLIRIALPPSTLGSLVKHTPRGIDVARGDMRKPHPRK